MEFRELVVWLGLLAMVIIVWDGLRRMKSTPESKAKSKAKKASADDEYVDPEELKKRAELARELPNGGARTREMTVDEKDSLKKRINLRERVPMLMERVEVAAKGSNEQDADEENAQPSIMQSELDFGGKAFDSGTQSLNKTDKISPDSITAQSEQNILDSDADFLFGAAQADDSATQFQYDGAEESEQVVNDDEAETSNVLVSDVKVATAAYQPVNAKEPIKDSAEIDPDPAAASSDDNNLMNTAPENRNDFKKSEIAENETVNTAEPVDAEVSPPGPVEDLVVIHVMARKGEELSGSLLLELLLRAGLRHGPMDIFHYRNPQGQTEFSMANCVQPGIFDPDSMGQLALPGITLFMQLPSAADAMESFNHMYEMAQFVAKHLDAVILDEDHSSVTPQRIAYYREKLRVFARSKLIPS